MQNHALLHEPADSSRLFVLQQMEDWSNVQTNSNRFKGLLVLAFLGVPCRSISFFSGAKIRTL